MNELLYRACERLAGATLTGLYQGIVVTALAALALRCLPRTNAATRHALWGGVLLIVAGLIPAHLAWSPPAPAPRTAASAPAADLATSATAQYEVPGSAIPPHPAPDKLAPAAPVIAAVDGAAIPAGGRAAVAKDAVATPPRQLRAAVPLPRWLCVGAVVAWALVGLLQALRLAGQLRTLRRLKARSRPAAPELQRHFDELYKTLAGNRPVRLRVADELRTAVVLGFVHPVVLVPAELGPNPNPAAVDQVLRHELAHVGRRDDWANLAQAMVGSALFFHPAIRWISRRLTLEREIACDDHVLAAAGTRPRDYALTLADLAGRLRPGHPLLAPGVSLNRSQLKQRITMILNHHRNRSPRLAPRRMGLLTSALMLLAALGLAAGPRLVVAQTAPPAPTPPPAPEPSSLPVVAAAPTASATPSALPSEAAVATGPRYKTGGPGAPAAEPHAGPALPATPAVPPIPPVAPAAPAPPAKPTAAAPAAAPVPMGISFDAFAPTPARDGQARPTEANVAERLDRIERMLEELRARQTTGARAPRAAANTRPVVPGNARLITSEGRNRIYAEADPKVIADIDRQIADANRLEADLAKQVADATRMANEAGRYAAEQGRRAALDAQREMDDSQRDPARSDNQSPARRESDLAKLDAEAPGRVLAALRQAHDSLGREMAALEKQIALLEAQRQPEAQTRSRKVRGKLIPAPTPAAPADRVPAPAP